MQDKNKDLGQTGECLFQGHIFLSLVFYAERIHCKKGKHNPAEQARKVPGKTNTSPCPKNRMNYVGSKCDHHSSFGERYKKCKKCQQWEMKEE